MVEGAAVVLAGLRDCVDGDFGVTPCAGMAREKKSIELRTVEEAPVVESDVVRLGVDARSVRVVPDLVPVRPPPDARLELPDADTERRTHEPGLEVLLPTEMAPLITDETHWGRTVVRRTPMPWGWFALLALVLAGAVAWSLSNVIQANRDVQGVQLEATLTLAKYEATDRQLNRSLQHMDEVARKFCEARTVGELLTVVRHPARVRPLMEKYYATTPLRPLGFRGKIDFLGFDLETVNTFWNFQAEVGDGSVKSLVIEQESDDVFRVDWEAAVMYQPLDWDLYAVERPPGSALEFRVSVQETDFYSHEFEDADHWRCFRLTTPKGAETLFGYVVRKSPVETALLKALEAYPGKPVALTLRLGRPAGLTSRRGVMIEAIASPQWFYVTPPEAGT